MTKGDELKYLLAPLLALALSGCSSSPSIEEQTKLVEYEKCLENASMRVDTFGELVKDSVVEFRVIQSYCESFRP
jgi:starvation-inducible outer membrane lipoprotein